MKLDYLQEYSTEGAPFMITAGKKPGRQSKKFKSSARPTPSKNKELPPSR